MTTTEKQKVDEGSLINSLKEDTGYLTQLYNERLEKEKKQRQAQEKEKNRQNQKEKEKQIVPRKPVSKTSGIYVPPHKLRQLQQEIMVESEASVEHQKLMWELLRKSINGIINKVNIVNIQNVVIELFNENIIRGKGLLARSIIKAQMASPNFTHVYTALIAVINTKFPDIVQLIISRVILQFQRAYMRNNKIVCMATTKMIAHLINQKVLGEYAGLQLLMITLENPTEDSVDIACDFMIEVGQVMTELNPAGANVVFERFKNILHEGEIAQKVQYSIENLFAIRKSGFKNHPGVIPELDLVELDDQITHVFDLEQKLDGEERLNVFREDPFYEKTEEEWEEIKKQILGEDNLLQLKQMPEYEDEADEESQQEDKIQDLTEKQLINLRKVIYLNLQSSVNYEQCAHKMLKMGVSKGHEYELCEMILECNMMERIYQKFFGLLAQRFCEINEIFQESFAKCFKVHFLNIFKQEGNKIRNSAKFFAHLFYTKALDWKAFRIIQLSQDASIESTTSTAASRIFLKIMFREIAENMGIEKLAEELNNPLTKANYLGMFPYDHPNSIRYAINYWTAIGLGRLTDDLRKILEEQEAMILQEIEKEEKAQLKAQNQYFEKQEKEKAAEEVELKDKKKTEKKKESSSSSSSSSNSSSSSSDSSSSGSSDNSNSSGSDSSSDSSVSRKRKARSDSKEKKNTRRRSDSRNKEKQRNRQKQRQIEIEKQKEYDRQKERQRGRGREIERERQRSKDKQRQRNSRRRSKQRSRGRKASKSDDAQKRKRRSYSKDRDREDRRRNDRRG